MTPSIFALATALIGTWMPVASVPAPAPPEFLFRSDFSTARGTSDAALRDAAKRVPWSMRIGNGKLNEVVPAAGLGFPLGMANVLKAVMQWNGRGAPTQLLRVINEAERIPVPAIGQSLFYRWYIRVDQPDAYTVDRNTHPIQDGNAASDCNWLFRVQVVGDGTYIGRFNVSNANTYPNQFWSPPALPKGRAHRYELQIFRNAAETFQMHVRVFDSSNTLVLSDRDFRNANRSRSLADNPSINIHVLANFAGLNAGHNGVFGAGQRELFPFVHSYQGGFAVCAQDWCGAYSPAESAP